MASGVFTPSKGWQLELPSVRKSLGLGALSGSALIIYQVGGPLWLGEARDFPGRNQDVIIHRDFEHGSDGDLCLGFRVMVRCDTFTENERDQVDYDYQSIVIRLRPDHPLHHSHVTEVDKSEILAVCPSQTFARRFIANEISCIKFSVQEGALFVEFGGEPWHISEPYVRKAVGCLASINSAHRVTFLFPKGSIPSKYLDRMPNNFPQRPQQARGDHNPPTTQHNLTSSAKITTMNSAAGLDDSVAAQADRFLEELEATLPAAALEHLDRSIALSNNAPQTGSSTNVDLAVLPCLEHRVTRLRVNTSRRNSNQVAQGTYAQTPLTLIPVTHSTQADTPPFQHPASSSAPTAGNASSSTNPLQHSTPLPAPPTARNVTSTAPASASAIATQNTTTAPRPAQITLPFPIPTPPYAPSFRFVHLPRYRAIQRTFSSRYSTEPPSPEAAWLLRQLEDAYGNEEEVAFQKAHDELLRILEGLGDGE